MMASRFSGRNFASCGRFGRTVGSLTPATPGDGWGGSRHPPNAAESSGRAQHGRGGTDQDGEERQAVEADNRGALHQPEVLAEAHPERVPGEAGEEVPAQPFARSEPESER